VTSEQHESHAVAWAGRRHEQRWQAAWRQDQWGFVERLKTAAAAVNSGQLLTDRTAPDGPTANRRKSRAEERRLIRLSAP